MTVRHLQLIPYSADDYSLGEAFFVGKTIPEAEITSLIDRIISLYFQWKDRANTSVIINKASNTNLSCVLDYDQDERSPSELYVITSSSTTQRPTLIPGSTIQIRIEIFGISYLFTVPVLLVNMDGTDPWLVVGVPFDVAVAKLRVLPRHKISKEQKISQNVYWISKAQEKYPADILEISLHSLVLMVNGVSDFEDGEINIETEEHILRTKLVRRIENKFVVQPVIDTPEQYGAFFNFYRSIVYPYLRPADEYKPQERLALFQKTGFLGKYSSNDVSSLLDRVGRIWTEIAKSQHLSSVDYVVINEEGSPIGASSIALAFADNKKPVWMLHQTCAVKLPELLESSGILYFWRMEYLTAYPSEMKVAVVFHSESRWHERIYTRFKNQSGGKARLIPVIIKRTQLNRQSPKFTHQFESYSIGSLKRISFCSNKFWAAHNPSLFNVANNLDEIIVFENNLTEENLKSIGNDLCHALDSEQVDTRVVMPAELEHNWIQGEILPSDRLCIFEKEHLYDLYRVVEHSLAVTERKYQG